MDSDTNRDRQDNEKAALKAIYGDQITINDECGTESWTPIQCVLRLGPQGVVSPPKKSPSVDLHIICPEDYPLVVPHIKLERWKRVANEKVQFLLKELVQLAEDLKGEVMIFELSQHVEKFLDECNTPEYESFYEEMVIRNKALEEQKRVRKLADDEKKKQEVKLEIHEKQQAVRKALRRRQNSIKSIEEDLEIKASDPDLERRCSLQKDEHESNEDTLYAKDPKIEYTPWSVSSKSHSRFEGEFEHLKWLGKGAFGDVIKVRNKLDGGLYAIKRIALNPSEKHLNKKITREVILLSRLNHENVVRYYNSWIERADLKSSSDSSSKPSTPRNLNDRVRDLLPHHEPSIEWNIDNDNSDSDESSSDWVMFRSISSDNDETDKGKLTESSLDTNSIKQPWLYMYIQMELCDKSTLRSAIDDGLHSDLNRVWRLFREISEGLCHIHQQGIIHRDLKPVNIFIGNDDHVKIGDFGLATTIVLQKQTVRDPTSTVDYPQAESSSIQTDFSQTGQVGTTLYVAPELNNYLVKAYNEKVDIFSLGVIFFEMCHPPMKTGSERIQVLTDLRKAEPVISKEFPFSEDSSQQQLIRWMLQYDVDKRPTAQELLQSSYIPPQKLEDKEVADMIRRTLSNPQTKNYNFLISSCFSQPVQPSLDATYNISSWRSAGFTTSLEVLSNKLRTIFQNHGAFCFSPPLLTPASQMLDSAVCLMTRLGSLVHATYDLQLPFARYLAQWPNNLQFKRYVIDKVFRERPAGVHPKESYECAFDIVTPTTGDLLPEYEMLCVIWEILSLFPSILRKNCTISLNHSELLSVMLKYSGLDEEKYKSLRMNIFQKKHIYQSKQDFEAYLKTIGLPERNYNLLLQWLEIEGPLNKVASEVMSMISDETEITMCKKSFDMLGKIVQLMEEIGINCPVFVNLGQIRNGHYFSGLMIQVQINQKNQPKLNESAVLLQGGRYDNLVLQLKEFLSRDDGKISNFVCGFTLSLDKFLFTIENSEKSPNIDVLVCAMGKFHRSPDKLLLLRDLWRSGVKTSFINTSEPLEELLLSCRGSGIPLIVVLKETEAGFARIRTVNKDRNYEKKVPYNELLDYVLKSKSAVASEGFNVKSETKSFACQNDGAVISFLTLEKLNPPTKRRYENQIHNNLSSLIQKFSNKIRIEVVALTMDAEVLKAVFLQIDSVKSEANLSPVMKKFPRFKKLITKLVDHIENVKSLSQSSVFVLYSLQDNVYKVLM